MTRARRLAGLATAALAIGACDAQVTSDYRGEPMVSIRSNIVNETPLGDAGVALLWWTAGGAELATLLPDPPGEFPVFTLSVYRRAPDAALVDVAGPGGAGGPVLSTPGFP